MDIYVQKKTINQGSFVCIGIKFWMTGKESLYAVCVLARYKLCITVVNYCNRILTNTSFLFMYSIVVQIRVCLPFHSGLYLFLHSEFRLFAICILSCCF